MVMEGKKRFGVFHCAEDSDYVKKKYGGIAGVFVRMLAEEGEIWEEFRPTEGELPKDEDLDRYDGFVITGSCRDAHSDEPWILKLCSILRKLHSMEKRVLGICFGHQVLCRALGGRTGRAVGGWDIGIRRVEISRPFKLLGKSTNPTLLHVIEFHRDEVLELPPFGEVLACSSKTQIEMFKCGDNILGIQGHPEYTKDILSHLIDRLLDRGLIKTSDAEAANANIHQEPSSETWRTLCRNFLKARL